MISILFQGWPGLSLRLLTGVPSMTAEKAGFGPAIVGSVLICGVCSLSALPLGVATAIFLEEYKPKKRVLKVLHGVVLLNITNLAGVPSVVYGVLGLTAFAKFFDLGNPGDPFFSFGSSDDWYYFQMPMGRGVLTGGLTLMLVVLPMVIVSAQESLRAVPNSMREAALALGTTKWQMVWKITLPAAVPGTMTGAILAVSRAIGEAAPILILAGIVYITFLPQNLMDDFTAMPLQIYDWANQPQKEFHRVSAAGIIVLLVVLLSFNALAIFIRQKFQKPLQ